MLFQAEEGGMGIHDELYEEYAALMSQPDSGSGELTFKTYSTVRTIIASYDF